MTTNNTKPIVAHGGPVTTALRAMRDADPSPWHSDGTAGQEWRAADFEARRAIAEGFHDRAELLELATAAYRGPVELARRMRETAFGSEGFPKRKSLAAYFRHLFGEDAEPDCMYAQSFAYRLQAIRPFIRSVH